MAHAGLDQPHAAQPVVDQVFERLAHAFADQRARGEVEHRVPSAVPERLVQRRRVADIGLDQPHALRHGGAMALTQIVDHHDLGAALDQRLHQMAADIAGAPGHHETMRHEHPLPDSAPRDAAGGWLNGQRPMVRKPESSGEPNTGAPDTGARPAWSDPAGVPRASRPASHSSGTPSPSTVAT